MCVSKIRKAFLIGLSAAVFLSPCIASATTIAYAAEFLPGGVNYVRANFIDPPDTIGDIMLTLVGAFAADDYSKQYWIDEALGRLHVNYIFAGAPKLIGTIDLQGANARGMHWDPTRNAMFLIANDEACSSTTLYRIDLADASTTKVGATAGCISGLAIDSDGNAFGVDPTRSELVSIDTGTGAATDIGPLNLDIEFVRGLDFDPEDGSLYVFGNDETSQTQGMFRVDTALGHATLFRAYTANLLAISLAPAPDSIMANGFEAP